MAVRGGTAASCNVSAVSTDNSQYAGGRQLSMECLVKGTDTFKDAEINAVGFIQKRSDCTGSLYDMLSKVGSAK